MRNTLDVSTMDILLDYWIEHVTFGLLYITITFPTRLFYMGVTCLQLIVLAAFGAVD